MKAAKSQTSSPQLSDSELHNLSNLEVHRLLQANPSRGTDPRQQRSALALRNALFRLLEQKDFDEITVREIVAEAGVNNTTFFRHHSDKRAFFDYLAQDEIDRLVAASIPSGHGLEGYIALCEYVRANRTLWSALLTGGASGIMRDRYIKLSKTVASEYTGRKTWLPHDLSIICSTAIIVETISWWLTTEEDSYSPQQIAEILNELIMSAIARPARKPKRTVKKTSE
ncbi:TetR/AcrR family transcriptional regulator [Novosphingobium kaempferiae]|uniref:TetR/AcrR family transcriptional regulator n=1 Tax=Novosphingobium kaempferiae TaxID=2896849 RepID=UPI001E3EC924|nr:TetR/AcrR family transcriptional regulator [Novosphingobium kaempferiae]